VNRLEFQVTGAEFVTSAVNAAALSPLDLPEIAFAGRSNVGKSSLINVLAGRRGLARTSAAPGRTATINLFRVQAKLGDARVEFALVDLPGYGYAKTGRATRREWENFVADYLANSPRLKLVCLLVDVRHPGLPADIEAFRWLTAHKLPVQVVATKADKLGRGSLSRNLTAIAGSLGCPRPIAFSALTGAGAQEILRIVFQKLNSGCGGGPCSTNLTAGSSI